MELLRLLRQSAIPACEHRQHAQSNPFPKPDAILAQVEASSVSIRKCINSVKPTNHISFHHSLDALHARAHAPAIKSNIHPSVRRKKTNHCSPSHLTQNPVTPRFYFQGPSAERQSWGYPSTNIISLMSMHRPFHIHTTTKPSPEFRQTASQRIVIIKSHVTLRSHPTVIVIPPPAGRCDAGIGRLM